MASATIGCRSFSVAPASCEGLQDLAMARRRVLLVIAHVS